MRLRAGLQILFGLALFALGAMWGDRIISDGPAAGLSAERMALRFAGALGFAAAGGGLIQKGLKAWYGFSAAGDRGDH